MFLFDDAAIIPPWLSATVGDFVMSRSWALLVLGAAMQACGPFFTADKLANYCRPDHPQAAGRGGSHCFVLSRTPETAVLTARFVVVPSCLFVFVIERGCVCVDNKVCGDFELHVHIDILEAS